MKVLCYGNGVPAKVGDVLSMRLDQNTEAEARLVVLPDRPGGWPVVVVNFSSVRVDPEKLGLYWEDRPEPVAEDALTVRDQYVMALIPLAASASLGTLEQVLDNAFELADYCMEKRK